MIRLHHGLFMALAAIAFTLAVLAPAYADNMSNGMKAYEDGQYEKAFELLFPVAHEGEVSAQSVIGSLYMDGKGTAQDVDEARKWFRRAAMQGDASAQYNLAVMLYNGEGGQRDDVEAYKFMLLAWKSGNKRASRLFKRVSADLTRQEKAAVENQLKDWKFGDPIPGADKDDKDEPKKKRKLFVD